MVKIWQFQFSEETRGHVKNFPVFSTALTAIFQASVVLPFREAARSKAAVPVLDKQEKHQWDTPPGHSSGMWGCSPAQGALLFSSRVFLLCSLLPSSSCSPRRLPEQHDSEDLQRACLLQALSDLVWHNLNLCFLPSFYIFQGLKCSVGNKTHLRKI